MSTPLKAALAVIERGLRGERIPELGTRAHDRLRTAIVSRLLSQRGMAPRGATTRAVRKVLAALSDQQAKGSKPRQSERTLPDRHRPARDPLRTSYSAQ